MAEKQNEADDVINNPETDDAEGATAAATTPVRRRSDQQRTSSTDAATACVDLLERRDPTAELQSGDGGRAASDEAASTSRSTDKPEASANDGSLPTHEDPRDENTKLQEEIERQQRQRRSNEIRRAQIEARCAGTGGNTAHWRLLRTRAKYLDEKTENIDRWTLALGLPETERAERAQRRDAEREERQARRSADAAAVHNTAERSVTEAQSTREGTVMTNDVNNNTGTATGDSKKVGQESPRTTLPREQEQRQQTRSAGEGAPNNENPMGRHTSIGPRNARIRINAPPSLRYAVTQLTFNEWIDLVTANPNMIYYEDDIENSPLVRNVRSQAATSEVTGSTPTEQTTDTNITQAAEEQQPNEAATRPPMRTSNDATTTENNKPTQ